MITSAVKHTPISTETGSISVIMLQSNISRYTTSTLPVQFLGIYVKTEDYIDWIG